MRLLRAVGLVVLSAVISTMPACKSAHLSGGKLHFDQGRYERAKEQFIQAAEEQPENAEVHLWLGRSYAELDEPESADAEFVKALELDPRLAEQVENTRGHYWTDRYNSGLSFVNQGYEAKESGDEETAQMRFNSALSDFNKAVIYDPNRQEARVNIGKLYYQMGRVDEAIEIFKQVQESTLAGDEASAEVTKLLVAVYWEMGDKAYQSEDWDNAIRFYESASELDPDEANLKYQLGSTYFQKALTVEGEQKAEFLRLAVDNYGAVLERVSGDEDALYNMTIALYELGDYEQGVERAKALLDMNPKDGDYHILLARMYGKMEMQSEFESHFIFGQALIKGRKDDVSRMRDEVQKYGPGTDILQSVRTMGEPEEVRRYDTSQGQEFLCWFYWSEGKAVAFLSGAKKYEISFKPTSADLGQK